MDRLEQIRQTLEEQQGPITPQYISGTTYVADVVYLLNALDNVKHNLGHVCDISGDQHKQLINTGEEIHRLRVENQKLRKLLQEIQEGGGA